MKTAGGASKGAGHSWKKNPTLGGSSHDLDTWLITMVIVSRGTLRIGLDWTPSLHGRFMAKKMGVTSYLQVLG